MGINHRGYAKKNKKALTVAILCLCIVTCSVGGVLAYLMDTAPTLSNEFAPAKVSCSVDETFENGLKSNVKITNTGDIDAYIRASVIVTFVSDSGKVSATSPKPDENYIISWGTRGWTQGSDGYWYYSDVVAPNEQTLPLIEAATEVKAPSGYSLNIQIVASAIQSVPETAAKEAWNVSFSDGALIPN